MSRIPPGVATNSQSATNSCRIPAYHASAHPAVLGRHHVPWEGGVTEEFAAARVAAGAELGGLYPRGERRREAYENWVKERKT